MTKLHDAAVGRLALCGPMVLRRRGVDVLIVDHNRDVAELVVYALTRAGLCAITAHDEVAARAALVARSPRVLVIDTVGFGRLEWLSVASGHSAIVVLSALELEYGRAAALELGVAYYLKKPFSYRALIDCVRACIRNGRRLAEAADAAYRGESFAPCCSLNRAFTPALAGAGPPTWSRLRCRIVSWERRAISVRRTTPPTLGPRTFGTYGTLRAMRPATNRKNEEAGSSPHEFQVHASERLR